MIKRAWLTWLLSLLSLCCWVSRPHNAPHSRVSEEQIHVYPNRIVIEVPGEVIWGSIRASKSMIPTFDQGHYTIEIKKPPQDELQVGDIISFWKRGLRVIHRIRRIDSDEYGWFAITQGDNNDEADQGKIRYWDILGVVIAIVY